MCIFLDMDEVLVDFIGGACRAWGVEKERVTANWPTGEWDIVPPLSKAIGQNLSQREFWQRINGSAEFWLNLESHSWMEELLQMVNQLTENWYIVSSPSHCQTSYDGKVRWLKNYFGSTFDRFAITPHKHLFAKPGVLLIDDRESNVQQFIGSGGTGILFPAHHNSLHQAKKNPITYLRSYLHAYQDSQRQHGFSDFGSWDVLWRDTYRHCGQPRGRGDAG